MLILEIVVLTGSIIIGFYCKGTNKKRLMFEIFLELLFIGTSVPPQVEFFTNEEFHKVGNIEVIINFNKEEKI